MLQISAQTCVSLLCWTSGGANTPTIRRLHPVSPSPTFAHSSRNFIPNQCCRFPPRPAYHSFAGQVEARTPPRYAAFIPSARHQLSRIALGISSLTNAADFRPDLRITPLLDKWRREHPHDTPPSSRQPVTNFRA